MSAVETFGLNKSQAAAYFDLTRGQRGVYTRMRNNDESHAVAIRRARKAGVVVQDIESDAPKARKVRKPKPAVEAMAMATEAPTVEVVPDAPKEPRKRSKAQRDISRASVMPSGADPAPKPDSDVFKPTRERAATKKANQTPRKVTCPVCETEQSGKIAYIVVGNDHENTQHMRYLALDCGHNVL